MNRVVSLIAAAAIASSAQAAAQQVEFDFSGTVEQAGGVFGTIALGSNVSGSFIIDLGNATDPDCFVAPILNSFKCEALSGTSVSGAVSTNYVIGFVVNLDGYTYRSADFPQGAYESVTRVEAASGIQFGGGTHYWWNGTESQIQEEPPTDNASSSRINLYNRDSRPYTNTGYPAFSGKTFGRGTTCARLSGPGTGGCVSYNITSITPLSPVPIYAAPPAPANSGGGSISFELLFAALIVGVFRFVRSGSAHRVPRLVNRRPLVADSSHLFFLR